MFDPNKDTAMDRDSNVPPDYCNIYQEEEYIVEDYGDLDEGVNHYHNDDDEARSGGATGRQLGGAAAVGGLAGLILVGPIVGLAAATGLAAVAMTGTIAGRATRASGESVANGATWTGKRCKQINEKHHVVGKTKKGVVKGAGWVSKKITPTNK